MQRSIYDFGLEKTAANHAPLTPLSFLARAAEVYPDRLAVVHGDTRFTWRETAARCRRLASALAARGIGPGDTVAAMLPNTPPMIEAHFGVPMTGAVLNALNTRLDADAIAFMLMHGEARAVLVDREFADVIRRALQRVDRTVLVIDCDDPAYEGPGERVGEGVTTPRRGIGDPTRHARWHEFATVTETPCMRNSPGDRRSNAARPLARIRHSYRNTLYAKQPAPAVSSRSYWESSLARRFFRLNRQHLAQVDAVTGFRSAGRGRLLVTLAPAADDEVLVSQESAAAFRAWIAR
jgi:acyl-CoA synthetase (AMP-forming)/AMP-acid ligase II